MKRIIFFRHLPYIWDSGRHMIKYTDFAAAVALGENLNIDVIIHSPRICDHTSALALATRSGCQCLVCDERLSSKDFLSPRRFWHDLENNAASQCETVAIIAGREPLELLGCPPLQYGEFYIHRKTPTTETVLQRGSIEDFQNTYGADIRPSAEIINYLY